MEVKETPKFEEKQLSYLNALIAIYFNSSHKKSSSDVFSMQLISQHLNHDKHLNKTRLARLKSIMFDTFNKSK